MVDLYFDYFVCILLFVIAYPLGLCSLHFQSLAELINKSKSCHAWMDLINSYEISRRFQRCLVCLQHGFAMRLHDAWCLGKCAFCSLACISGTLGGDVAQAQTRTLWKEHYKNTMLSRASSVFIIHCFSMLRCATQPSVPRLFKQIFELNE